MKHNLTKPNPTRLSFEFNLKLNQQDHRNPVDLNTLGVVRSDIERTSVFSRTERIPEASDVAPPRGVPAATKGVSAA